MKAAAHRLRKPHCFLVYALAPEGVSASVANDVFNDYIADPSLPVPLFHDHFIGTGGGVAIFYVESAAEQAALSASPHLAGWDLYIHPLIYSDSPAGFDEQIAFTLRTYRGLSWDRLQRFDPAASGSQEPGASSPDG